MSEIIDFYTRIKYKKDNMIKEDDILDDLDIYDAILELEYDTIVYYDEKLGKEISKLGIACFACTPDRLPELVENALKGNPLLPKGNDK